MASSDGFSSSSLTILEKLKLDCMLQVFSYLPVEDLVRSERVNKAWRDLVLYKLSITRTFTITNTTFGHRNKFTMSSLRQLLMKIGPGLRCLELNNGLRFDFDDTTPHLIAELCPNIQTLRINDLVNVKNWELLSMYCKDLKSVTFSYCTRVTDAVLSTFAPKLEELCIIRCNVTGSFLLDYQSSRIRKLELSSCQRLEPSLLCETIGKLKHLISLTLDYPSEEMYKQLHDILVQLPQLQEFSCCDFNQFNVDDYSDDDDDDDDDDDIDNRRLRMTVGSLVALGAMKDLRVLKLESNRGLNSQILKDICTNCTRLRVLYIKSRSLTSSSDVWMLPELEELEVYLIELPSSAEAKSFNLKVLRCTAIDGNTLQRLLQLNPMLSVLYITDFKLVNVSLIKKVIAAVNLNPKMNRKLIVSLPIYLNYLNQSVDRELLDCRSVKVLWR